jgi:hypothetical protein
MQNVIKLGSVENENSDMSLESYRHSDVGLNVAAPAHSFRKGT